MSNNGNPQQKHNTLSFKFFQPTIKRPNGSKTKKSAPPPRPPPPSLTNMLSRSKSMQLPARKSHVNEMCLIDFSTPPNSPNHGSGSDGLSLRSFSSEASSSNHSSALDEPFDPFGSISEESSHLPTSKSQNNFSHSQPLAWDEPDDPFKSIALRKHTETSKSTFYSSSVPPVTLLANPPKPKTVSRATIIRPKKLENTNNNTIVHLSAPEPKIDINRNDVPHATVIYDLAATVSGDLSLKAGQKVQLLYRVNNDWLFGRISLEEGMFPEAYVQINVPLIEAEVMQPVSAPPKPVAKALYAFQGEVEGDLTLKEGDEVTILSKINDEWLLGEVGGRRGQFPASFVDIPAS